MSITTIVITVMAIIIALLVGFIGWAIWSVATEPDAPQPKAPPSPSPEEVRRQLIAQQQAETDAYYRAVAAHKAQFYQAARHISDA